MKSPNSYDVIVIGGGASGMMAAATAGAHGKRVLLLEKNTRLGEKLRISGGGRCNITNAEYDQRVLLTHYGAAEHYLYSPCTQFGVADTFAYFEQQGVPLEVEARKRAFPKSRRAEDVCSALARALDSAQVIVQTKHAVEHIIQSDGHIHSIVANGTSYTANTYVLATGGVSHPETGSTGDGFKWLALLGHTVIAPTPSIVPLVTREKWSHALAGVTLHDVKVTFFSDSQKAFHIRGDILLTHVGLSGPTILNAATNVSRILEQGEVTARIDCYPLLDLGALDRHIVAIFDAHKNRQLKNVFRQIAPQGTASAILSLVPTIDSEQEVHSVTKTDRKMLVDLLKALPLTIAGLRGHGHAVVADGGVLLSEIDTKTMRSRLVDNVAITGDLLHIHRPSGGYSLQLCWTTGYVAGLHA